MIFQRNTTLRYVLSVYSLSHNLLQYFSPILPRPRRATLRQLHPLRWPLLPLLRFNQNLIIFNHSWPLLESEQNIRKILDKDLRPSSLLTPLHESVLFAFCKVLMLILSLLVSVQIYAQQWTKQTNQLDPAKKRKTESTSQPVSKKKKPTASTSVPATSKLPKAIKMW